MYQEVNIKGTYVVVEVGVRDSNEISRMAQIDQPIVSVLAHILVAGKIEVVNPHVGRQLNGDGITIVSKNLGDLQVPDDHILLSINGEANAG